MKHGRGKRKHPRRPIPGGTVNRTVDKRATVFVFGIQGQLEIIRAQCMELESAPKRGIIISHVPLPNSTTPIEVRNSVARWAQHAGSAERPVRISHGDGVIVSQRGHLRPRSLEEDQRHGNGRIAPHMFNAGL